jgi:DNA mismatch repair protein MutL
MATIRVLSPELASQIAAGEVVERPASALKELVENALDAGATRCDVEIAGGGVTEIRVSDDGSGMSEQDARLAVERHATSKIASLAELERVTSYGFRGEALPSIASVSRLSLRTRAPDATSGVEVAVEGGTAPVVKAVGAPAGTTVSVRDLFFNVPARRKFLRSSGTESGHVSDVLEAFAMAQPGLTFTLTRDGRLVREWLRAPSREERVRAAYDEDLGACRGERGPLAIEAYLSRPERARVGAAGLRLMVNGRPVRDRALAATVAQAYGSVLERGRYPRGVVYLDLPPELVDVNVHPQKSEVRFADPRAVSDALYSTLSRALASAFSLPAPSRASWGRTPSAVRDAAPPRVTGAQSEAVAQAANTAGAEPARAEPLLAVHDAAAPIRPGPAVRWANLRFVAQVRQMYLICEGDEGLFVLDQHAAAERVTFHRLRSQYQARAVASQALLFPLTLEVTPAEAELIQERANEISGVGLELSVRGPESVSVHAVPRLLQQASPERIVRDLLAEVSRGGGRGFSDAIDLALATMACHGSIRAGDPMSADEASALLEALDGADFAGHCPHGRPVVTFTSWNELERRVGRR